MQAAKQPAARAPRLAPRPTQNDAPRSPSLLRSVSETAEAVGCCFDGCHQLYSLVADAVVGRNAHHDTAMALRKVSRSFCIAVRNAIESWCTVYRLLQSTYAGRSRQAPLADHSRVLMKLHEYVSAAFEENYVTALDELLMLSSRMDYRTYMHVQARRCVLCSRSMPPNPERTRHLGWYVHAHAECVAKHCVPKMTLQCMVTLSRPYSACTKSVDRDGAPRVVDDAVAVANHFIKIHTRDDLPRGYVADMVDKMTACGVLATRNSGLVWVHPHHAVSWTDTLLGALKITPEKLDGLHREAHRIRMENVEESRRRQERRTQKLVVMAEDRMNEFAAELLRQGGRVRTAVDVESLHPNAAELFGLRRLAAVHNYLRVKTVLRRIDLFEAFTTGHNQGEGAYKTLKTWLLSDTVNFHKLLTVFNLSPGSGPKMNEEMQQVARRMADMLLACRPDVDYPDFVSQTVADGEGLLISMCVRMCWPGIGTREHWRRQEITVLQLRMIRTKICDLLGVLLPPIPHPKSECYQESGMTDALQQLVAACFDRRTLHPEAHGQGLALVGAHNWLWRLHVACENANQVTEEAALDHMANNGEDGGGDSDTSGGWW